MNLKHTHQNNDKALTAIDILSINSPSSSGLLTVQFLFAYSVQNRERAFITQINRSVNGRNAFFNSLV